MMDPHPVSEVTEEERLRFYRGQSMRGTFQPGDYLTLEPVRIAEIRPGDVVIYQACGSEGEPDDIVHRVVAVRPGELVARGDNNPTVDNVLVTEENLVGRVTHAERDGRVRPVHGGRRGLWHARAHRVRAVARWHGGRIARLVGRWPYRALRRSGLVARLWRPAIVRLRVETDNGPLVKYISGGRTVARWWPKSDRFQCRRPYDLILVRPECET